jgi:hypothetical protein
MALTLGGGPATLILEIGQSHGALSTEAGRDDVVGGRRFSAEWKASSPSMARSLQTPTR